MDFVEGNMEGKPLASHPRPCGNRDSTLGTRPQTVAHHQAWSRWSCTTVCKPHLTFSCGSIHTPHLYSCPANSCSEAYRQTMYSP